MSAIGRRAAWTGVVLLGLATSLVPSPASAGGQQAVRAADGLTAGGSVRARFPDGTERYISVVYVAPRGVVASTGSAGDVDIARPFVVIEETITADPANGNRTMGTVTCSQVSNPAVWSAGSLTAKGDQWAGAFVEVRCPNSPYDTYRIRWDPDWYLVTGLVPVAWMTGPVGQWSTMTARGTIQLVPKADQASTMTLCAMRRGRSDCTTDEAATVVPSTDGMVVTAVLH